VDAPYGVDLASDGDMKRDGEDEEEEDEEEEDEEEEEEEDVDEDDDDGKEPWTIGQGEMVNTSPDNADTMVDDEPTVLPGQRQEMCKYIPWPQPLAPTPRQQTPAPRSLPHTPETHLLRVLEHLGLVRPQKPCAAARTLREAEAAGNTTHLDMDQQLLGESAGGNSLSHVGLPDVPHPDIPLPKACLDRSVGEG